VLSLHRPVDIFWLFVYLFNLWRSAYDIVEIRCSWFCFAIMIVTSVTAYMYFNHSNCSSEVRYFNDKTSSGPPEKKIKTIFLTDTKQLKVSNFFTSKSVDTATTVEIVFLSCLLAEIMVFPFWMTLWWITNFRFDRTPFSSAQSDSWTP